MLNVSWVIVSKTMNRNAQENWEKLKELIEIWKVMKEDKIISEIKTKKWPGTQGKIDT